MGHRKIIEERAGMARAYEYRISSERSLPLMLTVELHSRRRHSVCYSNLRTVEFTGRQIQADFTSERIEIHGANLGVIHNALTSHRLAFVRRSPQPASRADDPTPHIEEINLEDWRRKRSN